MSPLLLAIIGLLIVAFVMIQIVSDTYTIRHSKRIARQLMLLAKQHNKESFTVLIELAKSPATILGLLDDIYAQEYPHLQVVVIVKQTAGKNALDTLEKYRRSFHRKNLRLVRHTRGSTTKMS